MVVSERGAGVERARDAFSRQAWAEAVEWFRSADPSTLTPGDLEGFAAAAWWLSHADEAVGAWQRALMPATRPPGGTPRPPSWRCA
ncbi:MAG: hypothetical protein ACJ77A_00980 [Actinomycetota bacterium]